MKIWWCQEHKASAELDQWATCCRWEAVGLELGMQPCRMVPMRLIPDNALRRRIGQALVRYIDPERSPSVIVDMTDDLLAALDGETP